MSIEDNKRLATEFFTRFDANDIAGALDTMSEDATWWLPGKEGQIPVSGVQTKAQIAHIFEQMVTRTKDGLRMTVKSLIAEGEKVALEVESYGELQNGRVYNQEYHTLMMVRDGKICEVREYLDTQHVMATWFDS
jgi:hypothetical protein